MVVSVVALLSSLPIISLEKTFIEVIETTNSTRSTYPPSAKIPEL